MAVCVRELWRRSLGVSLSRYPPWLAQMAAGNLRLPGEGILIGDKYYSGVLLSLENCILPAEQLCRTPSTEHGLSSETEEQLRIRGCEMIQAAGILLRLPQVEIAHLNPKKIPPFNVYVLWERIVLKPLSL